jgi:hypothetical protein
VSERSQKPHNPSVRDPGEESAFAEPDNVRPVEVRLYDDLPMPVVVENLAVLNHNLPQHPNTVFTFKFLKKVLGGSLVSRGWHFVNSKPRQPPRQFPDLKGYLIPKRAHEPLLSRSPGQHGAQISSFIHYRNDDEWLQFPLFICDEEGRGYRYFGIYQEPSASDLISRNEMLRLPEYVKTYWATELGTSPPNGKPWQI